MTLNNNLYPPIIDTYQQTTLRDKQTFRIEFTLSQYNSKNDICGIQVYISRQTQSYSVFDVTKYPGGVKFIPIDNVLEISDTLSDSGNPIYYIDIPSSDIVNRYTDADFENVKRNMLKDNIKVTDDMVTAECKRLFNGLLTNEYYKIQLRFIHSSCPPALQKQLNAAELISCQNYLSEWSTVSLIKAISTPTVVLRHLNNNITTVNLITSNTVNVFGKLEFADKDLETEGLASYNIQLYERESILDSGIEVYQSEELYVTQETNHNEFNKSLNVELKELKYYTLYVNYTTTSGYQDCQAFQIRMYLNDIPELRVDMKITQDKEQGCAIIALQSQGETPKYRYTGPFTIRRTSSKSNYEYWEDIYTSTTYSKLFDFKEDVYRDYYIEAGVFYRYAVQSRNSDGARGHSIIGEFYALDQFFSVMKTNNIIYDALDTYYKDIQDNDSLLNTGSYSFFADFEDVFLSNLDRQLKLKFDTTIDSLQSNIIQNKFETLGSKYPFIVRGSAVNYRTFTLSGLVSALSDEDELFMTDEELYNGSISEHDYHNYFTKYNIIDSKNFYKEKIFREKVMEFLYADEHKMFRSAAEGNIIVRLMDITFSPKQELGRMLYSFSCTAVEVADFNYEDLYQQKTDPNIYTNFALVPKIRQFYAPLAYYNEQNLIDVIKDDIFIDNIQGIKRNYAKVKEFKWINIECHCNSYIMKNNLVCNPFQITFKGEKPQEYMINSKTNFLHLDLLPTASLQETLEYQTLTELTPKYTKNSFTKDDYVLITYAANFIIEPDVTTEIDWLEENIAIGQYNTTITDDTNIIDFVLTKLKEQNKYEETNSSRAIASLERLYYIMIEDEPGTLYHVTTFKDITKEGLEEEIDCRIPESGVLILDYSDESRSIASVQAPAGKQNFGLITYKAVLSRGGYKKNASTV